MKKYLEKIKNLNKLEKPEHPLIEKGWYEFKNKKEAGRQKKYFFGVILFGALIFIASGAFFLYKITIPTIELPPIKVSQFELTPKTADAAGIAPNTGFFLKSSIDLRVGAVEKNLQFVPETDFEIKKTSKASSASVSSPADYSFFEITPKSNLEEGEIYSVKIAQGEIAARDYSWAYQVKAPFQVTSTLPRDKSNNVPINTGIEITFNRENIINYENSLEISPKIAGKLEVRRDILVFIPSQKLTPKAIYTITIKAGIGVEGSKDVLAEDKTIKFETSSEEGITGNEPNFSFEKTFWEFKSESEATLEIYHSNLPSKTVPLAVYKFDSVEEFIDTYKETLNGDSAWLSYNAYSPATPPDDKKIFDSNVPLEEQEKVKFIRVPQKLSDGYYLADVLVNDEHSQTWFQMTNLASFSATSDSKTFVWLKNLANGNHITDADIFFEGDILGKSNNEGVALFETPSQLIMDYNKSNSYYFSSLPTYFYTIASGGKKLAIPIENNYGYMQEISPSDSWWDYLSVDKNIYLPTDTVNFWGIVKQRNNIDIKGEELNIRLTNPYWQGTPKDEITIYAETKSTIDEFYTVSGKLNFADLETGFYTLSVLRGNEIIVSENINIATYIKPAYKIDITPDKKAIFAGNTVNYQVKAEFFDSIPVSNLKIKYGGYYNDEISGEISLNQNGEGSFKIKTDYIEDSINTRPRYLGISVSPSVAEEGDIVSSSSVLVFGPNIDLLSKQTVSNDASNFNLELRSLALDKVTEGKPYWWNSDEYLNGPVPNWNINVDVTEIIYNKKETRKEYDIINKVTYPVYTYSTEKIPVTKETLTTNEEGKASFEWKPEENKRYNIVFSARDGEGRLVKKEHYSYGRSLSNLDQFYGWPNISLNNLGDENEYQLNQAIHLQIQDRDENALKPEPGRFVFLVANGGINSYQVSDSPNYDDSFKDSYLPNVNITGVWFNGSRFYDTFPISLSFDAEERRLNLEVKSDKQDYRPKEKVNLDVLVTDKNGEPKQAEINIAGIDEAIFTLNPDEKDIITNLYRDNFSIISTRSSHQSELADRAEGGGGGGDTRADFRDIAIFQSVTTNSKGQAKVSFELPDNLTSWRLTTQAITTDLFAGKTTDFVSVNIPFFVETSINRTYLAGDELTLRARTFGKENIKNNITYTIESETLPFKKIEETGKDSIEIPLGALTTGNHKLKISAKSGKNEDAIIRDLSVLSSYFSKSNSEFYELTPTLSNIKGSNKGFTTLVFSSYERGRFYQPLKSLSYTGGERVDQKISNVTANSYLNEFFEEENEIGNTNFSNYQTQDGGISLLPHSDNDLALSAKFTNLIRNQAIDSGINKERLKQYFDSSLKDRKTDLGRIAVSLYGLSALDESVLVTLQNIKDDSGLSLIDKIYIALALDNLGAKEEARDYYQTEIEPSLATQKPYVFVKSLGSQDDNILATTLLADLAVRISEDEANGLGQYALENYPKETLKNIEVLLYIKSVLPTLSKNKVSFSYNTSSKKDSKTLEKGEIFKLELSSQELSELKFSDIDGKIGLVSDFETASSPSEIQKDTNIGVARKYSVNDKATTEFNEGDLVKIELTPSFTSKALDGSYQVTDHLPSGLRAVTDIQKISTTRQDFSYTYTYPSSVTDQKVNFVVWEKSQKPLTYYARVVSKGIYKAEPTIVQSLKSLESINVSGEEKINIK